MDQLAQAAVSAMQPKGAPPPQPAPGGQPAAQGSLRQLAETFAKCQQTGQCTPEDLAILKQGLPNLVKMAQTIQQMIQAGAQQPQGAPGG